MPNIHSSASEDLYPKGKTGSIQQHKSTSDNSTVQCITHLPKCLINIKSEVQSKEECLPLATSLLLVNIISKVS